MYSSLSYSISPCPVSSHYLMQHTRIDNFADLDLVTAYANTATQLVESYLSRFLITRDVVWTLAHHQHHGWGEHVMWLTPWPWTTFIQNPVAPLPRPATAVNSVSIGQWGESAIQLIEGTDYQVDCTASIGRIKWISNAFKDNNLKSYLQVNFTSGFGTEQTDIPTPILHAIALLVTRLYEYRGEEDVSTWTPGIESMLSPFRFTYFG
jgi:uncharacterized phiE125 gp8 family phage protein